MDIDFDININELCQGVGQIWTDPDMLQILQEKPDIDLKTPSPEQRMASNVEKDEKHLAKLLYLEGYSTRDIAAKILEQTGKKIGKSAIAEWCKKNNWKALKKHAHAEGIAKAKATIVETKSKKVIETNTKIEVVQTATQIRFNQANNLRNASIKIILETLFVDSEQLDDKGKPVKILNPRLPPTTVLKLGIDLYRASNLDLEYLEDLLKETPDDGISENQTWFDKIEGKL